MVVAINKVDLPDANLAKVERELYSLELLPDTMGGNVPFVQTSAKTGKGIDELLEQISLVAELAELKANPNKPATGTCLEAYLSGEEGVLATLLVQNGTLRHGDVVLCGASYGRVRAMYDDQGRSIEAIRKELEKLQHEEVRVRLLHTGIGAITESDIQLALTSPQDTLILGFNVVPDDRARALAEERGVQIRLYTIIYQLTDDIRAALEGKLKPREEVVHLGRALVRETFKISRVGTIAGCSVTKGTVERSAKVRVIRDGVVVYPPADRTVGLESLKRFKEDVREVREGFECGLKIAGYDDIKVGDVIEAFRVEQVQRTLEK